MQKLLRVAGRMLLIMLVVVLTAVQGIAINLGTSEPLPGILEWIAEWPWYVMLLSVVGLVVVGVIDWLLEKDKLRMSNSTVSLRRQLAKAKENLRLIQERKSEYPLSTDVPINLIKEERRLEDEIKKLNVRIEDRYTHQDNEHSTYEDKRMMIILVLVITTIIIGVSGMYVLMSSIAGTPAETNIIVRVTDQASRSMSGARVTLFYSGKAPPTDITANGIATFTVESSAEEGQLIAELEGYQVAQEIIGLQESDTVQMVLRPLDADNRSVLVRVIRAEEFQPVANAEVILIIEGRNYVGTTDDNGLVKFELPFTGELLDATITVDAEGSRISNQNMIIKPDQLQEIQITADS